jgi:hypothetical protein
MRVALIENEVLETTLMDAVPFQTPYFVFGGGRRRTRVKDRTFGFHTSGEVARSHGVLQLPMEGGKLGVRAEGVDGAEEGLPNIFKEGLFANV